MVGVAVGFILQLLFAMAARISDFTEFCHAVYDMYVAIERLHRVVEHPEYRMWALRDLERFNVRAHVHYIRRRRPGVPATGHLLERLHNAILWMADIQDYYDEDWEHAVVHVETTHQLLTQHLLTLPNLDSDSEGDEVEGEQNDGDSGVVVGESAGGEAKKREE